MSTPGGGLRRSRSGQAPDDRAGGSAGPVASRPGLFSAGWVGLLGAVLAVAAASVVVLSDDVRWLRLAVVAALWAALLVLVVLVRRGAAGCGCAAEAEGEADRWREAYESELAELEDALAERREDQESREHDLRVEVAREVEARHSDEIAGLRAEVERLQAEIEARSALRTTVVATASRPARATDVRAPQQRMTALDSGPGVRAAAAAPDRAPVRAAASMPVPPTVPPPAPPRVAWPVTPVPPPPAPPAPPSPAAPTPRPEPRATSSGADRGPAARLPHPPPGRGPGEPRPSVLDQGSFVDQYVRSTGLDPEAPAVAPAPEAAPTTTGRTVAELLAAHSAARGTPPAHHRPAR